MWKVKFVYEDKFSKEFMALVHEIEEKDEYFRVCEETDSYLVVAVTKEGETKRHAWGRAMWIKDKLAKKGLPCPYFKLIEEVI